MIEIEDDYSAETDALRFSDDDQYAGYDDGSSSDSHNDEFEVTRYNIIYIYISILQLYLL